MRGTAHKYTKIKITVMNTSIHIDMSTHTDTCTLQYYECLLGIPESIPEWWWWETS